MALDSDDLEVLDALQWGLPLTETPFADVGAAHGWTEAHVLGALGRAKGQGALSRVGPVFAPGTVGVSTLAALAVPPERLEAVARLVSALDEVNHNYERLHPEWNLWFVVTAPDEAHLRRVLDGLARDTGLAVLDLRLVRPFHLDLGFPLVPGAPRRPTPRGAEPSTEPFDEAALVAAVQDGVALVPRPFDSVATTLGCRPADVTARLAALQARGALKRFGAVVLHRALGWTHNAMCVFDVPEVDVAAAAEGLARAPGVTLCYQRRPAPEWPYSLYCMVHGRGDEAVRAQVADVVGACGLSTVRHEVLVGGRCFTQRGARYARAPGHVTLDDFDRALINRLQHGVEVVDRPFAALAAKLGLTENEVVARVHSLLARGALSRFGPMFDLRRFGGHFSLVAMAVPAERFDAVAELVNGYPEVAHNYEREHALNLWFVVATETRARCAEVLADIARRTGLQPFDFPKEREYFLELKVAV